MSILVENLPYDANKDDLKTILTEYGTVTAVMVIDIPADSERNEEPRSLAFVNLSTDAEEDQAIAQLNGVQWMGRTIKVNKSRPHQN